jgi:hypothetical protein
VRKLEVPGKRLLVLALGGGVYKEALEVERGRLGSLIGRDLHGEEAVRSTLGRVQRRVTAAHDNLGRGVSFWKTRTSQMRVSRGKDRSYLLRRVLDDLKVIRDLGANRVLALLELLGVPKMVLPSRQRTVLPLKVPPLHPESNTTPNAPAEVRCEALDGYILVIAQPVARAQLGQRNRLDGVVDA